MCPETPRQTPPSRTTPWLHGDFMITALANYDIVARVLGRKNYCIGTESDLSPIDIVLGWGRMSDNTVLKQLDISQSRRWYKWRALNYLPIPQKEIERSSANVHIIPGNKDVERAIDSIYVGSIVHLKGYLVKCTRDDNWRWVSSTSRTDTGDGACEVFWVEYLNISN